MLSALAALVLAAEPAFPTPKQLSEVQRAFDELQFEQVAALPPPTQWKRLGRAEVLQGLSLRALALASIKRDDEAGLALRQLLSLEPGFVLPDQFGPRVRTLLLEQRDAVGRAGPLQLEFAEGAFVTKGSSFGLAEQLAVAWVDAEGRHDAQLPLAERTAAPWPANAAIKAWARVLGAGGCELVTWKSEQAPFVVEGPAVKVEKPVEVERRSLSGTAVGGLVVGGVALAALAGGLAAVVLADRPRQALASATRDAAGNLVSPTQKEAFALDAQAQTAWQVGGALLITAGLAAAGSVSLFLLGPVTVSASPSAVALELPFDALFSVGGGS